MTMPSAPATSRGVAITAAGLVSPLGRGIASLWEGLCEQRRCFAPQAGIIPATTVRVAAVADSEIDPELADCDRAIALAVAALDDLLADPAAASALRASDPARVGVCVGSTQGSIGRWERQQRSLAAQGPAAAVDVALPDANAPLIQIARRTAAAGPRANPALACASGTGAVALAADWIASGRCDAVIAGGVDALSCLVYRGFASLRAIDPLEPRPFDVDRAGMGLGEAAALLLLEAVDPTDQPRASSVRVTGWGLTSDARHLTAPDPEGAGLARAIERALARARSSADRAVDCVNAHGTATVFNDLMEAKALARTLGDRLAAAPVNAIKGAIGHTLAAAGAIEAIVCKRVLETGLIPPTVNLRRQDPATVALGLDVVARECRPGARQRALSTAAGFGGINAALVLDRVER